MQYATFTLAALLAACSSGSPPGSVSLPAARTAVSAAAASPYPMGAFVFSHGASGGVASVLARYATSNTLMQVTVWNTNPTIKSKVPFGNTQDGADCLNVLNSTCPRTFSQVAHEGVSIARYDMESWSKTPSSEYKDPIGSTAQAAKTAHDAGVKFMFDSNGSTLGTRGCAFSPSAAVQGIDWSHVDYVDAQLQDLAAPPCDYSAFTYAVQRLAAVIHAKNPNAKIYPHLSLDVTTPATIVAAAKSVESVPGVAGIYVGYGTGYSTPANLDTVLNGLFH